MNDQKKMEIIKALAYGESPSLIAECEGVTEAEVEAIAASCAGEIAVRRAKLREEGYLERN